MNASPTILLAEDQPILRRAIQYALSDQGFTVRATEDGNDTCALIDEMKDDCPELLITDIDLPGSDGEQLATYARRHIRGIKLIFMSGGPQPGLLKSIATDPHARFLEKPFPPADLMAAIRELGIVAPQP